MITLSGLTGDYVIDAATSRVGFVARHTMATRVRGRFDEFVGHARLDGDDPARSAVDLTIGARSIQTGNRGRDEQLRTAFLRVDDHPDITFGSTRVEPVDRTTFTVAGDLTIRGVTRPVSVPFRLTAVDGDPSEGGLRAGFAGTVVVDRMDWGVNWNAATGVLVARKVTLTFDVAVIRRSAMPGAAGKPL